MSFIMIKPHPVGTLGPTLAARSRVFPSVSSSKQLHLAASTVRAHRVYDPGISQVRAANQNILLSHSGEYLHD